MSTSDSIDIQISIVAMAKMIKFDLDHPGKETAGLLIGKEIDGIVYVEDIRVGDQVGNAVHVEISDQELMKAAIEISEAEDGRVIIGWWHTHPGLTAFMSQTDVKTQSIYQALMPKAVAIVIDNIKFSKTQLIDDLDFGVFRLVNGKATKVPYTITNLVEFGLVQYITSDKEVVITPKIGDAGQPKYFVSYISKNQLIQIRNNLEDLRSNLSEEDYEAVKLWLEFNETVEDGAVKEVPIDAQRLLEALDNSLTDVADELEVMNDMMLNQQAQRSLIVIVFVLVLEFLMFYSFAK